MRGERGRTATCCGGTLQGAGARSSGKGPEKRRIWAAL
ncbi:hypothetical protein AB205_0057940 [Aquarana catesbeiana]|uniref:Uncharacterized protein n=1 Tax=Aquarana catesbeiana TaxID=8400 RepID=A0A2G9RU24_AQUCT|nr:hypothetical protein AB205_0057940 [Aquarana catesbeiana]